MTMTKMMTIKTMTMTICAVTDLSSVRVRDHVVPRCLSRPSTSTQRCLFLTSPPLLPFYLHPPNRVLAQEDGGTSPLKSVCDSNMCLTENGHFFN